MLDLLLLGHDLLVKQVDLLRGNGLFVALGLFPRGGCLSTNVVEGFFAVRAKLGVLKFPCLRSVLNPRPNQISSGGTYVLPVWRLSIFLIVLSHLVEVIFVQLTYKAGKVAVFEVFG